MHTPPRYLRNAGHGLNELTFHHDFLPLDNGHLIMLGSAVRDFYNLPGYPGSPQVFGDVLVDLDANWNLVWFWSAFDRLDVNRHLMGLTDWTHSSAVVDTPNDSNWLISMRNQSWILKIDYEMGPVRGFVKHLLLHTIRKISTGKFSDERSIFPFFGPLA